MAIDTDTHRTGTVRSGEVELFHRRFGRPGAAPVLILHGAGYYDSADWISVGAALAGDREVVAFDARGYGRSAWSVSHDYSLEAQLADIEAILDHLAWPEVVLLGHSRGGGFAIQYAAAHPERLAGLILADHCPGRTARGAAGSAGPPAGTPGSSVAEIFPTLADALASTSRDPNSLERPAARARLEEIFLPAAGGYRLALRDPAFQSPGPAGTRPRADPWRALAELTVPLLVIRATRSLTFDDPSLERLLAVAPSADVVEIDSGHDLAQGAPDELIAAVRAFLS